MMRRLFTSRWAVAAFAALLTAALVGGISYAVADTASGTDTFYACVSASGVVAANTIQVNQRPTSCPRGDVVTSWNAQGQIGPQGPVGQASVVSLVPSAAVTCPTPPAPSGDPAAGAGAFLNIPNIPGEATDEHHADEIDVLSWSWGTSAGSHASCGTARQGGTGTDSTFLDLTVVKRLDKASPKLMLAVASGTQLGTIKLSLEKQGTDYLVITLENAIASSLVSLGSNGSEIVPREQVTFNATKVTMQYKAQQSDGSFGIPITTCFDALVQAAC
jgi:type VI secretion system secreted protein Hcp